MKIERIAEFVMAPRRRMCRWSLLGLVVLEILDKIPLVIDKKHAHTSLELLPGFWSIFGLVGCLAIILLSKWFGHAGIMRGEDYYDE
jgi:hypothetical protein